MKCQARKRGLSTPIMGFLPEARGCGRPGGKPVGGGCPGSLAAEIFLHTSRVGEEKDRNIFNADLLNGSCV